MRRPEWANHTIAVEAATTEAATTFLSATFAKECQPTASIRLLRRIATAKPSPSPKAA